MQTSQRNAALRANVTIEFEGGLRSRGLLIENSPEAVVVDFALARSKALEVGGQFTLEFEGGRGISSLRVTGIAQFRGEDSSRCRCRFRIAPEDAIAVGSLVENRGTMRVPPAEAEQVMVEVWNPQGQYTTAPLETISRTGISLLAAASQLEMFSTKDVLTLRFMLPRQTQPVLIYARLRSRLKVGEVTRFGFEYVADGAVYFLDELRKIDDYVIQRQGELLRLLQRIG